MYVYGLLVRPRCLNCSAESLKTLPPELCNDSSDFHAGYLQSAGGGGGPRSKTKSVCPGDTAALLGSFAQARRRERIANTLVYEKAAQGVHRTLSGGRRGEEYISGKLLGGYCHEEERRAKTNHQICDEMKGKQSLGGCRKNTTWQDSSYLASNLSVDADSANQHPPSTLPSECLAGTTSPPEVRLDVVEALLSEVVNATIGVRSSLRPEKNAQFADSRGVRVTRHNTSECSIIMQDEGEKGFFSEPKYVRASAQVVAVEFVTDIMEGCCSYMVLAASLNQTTTAVEVKIPELVFAECSASLDRTNNDHTSPVAPVRLKKSGTCSSTMLSLHSDERTVKSNDPRPLATVSCFGHRRSKICVTGKGTVAVEQRNFVGKKTKRPSVQRYRNGIFLPITNVPVPVRKTRRKVAAENVSIGGTKFFAQARSQKQGSGARSRGGLQAGIVGANIRLMEARMQASEEAVKKGGFPPPEHRYRSGSIGFEDSGDSATKRRQPLTGFNFSVPPPGGGGSSREPSISFVGDLPRGELDLNSDVGSITGEYIARTKPTATPPCSPLRSQSRPSSSFPAEPSIRATPDDPTRDKTCTRYNRWCWQHTASDTFGGEAIIKFSDDDGDGMARTIHSMAVKRRYTGGGIASAEQNKTHPRKTYRRRCYQCTFPERPNNCRYIYAVDQGKRVGDGPLLWGGSLGNGGIDGVREVRGDFSANVEGTGSRMEVRCGAPPAPPKRAKTRSFTSPRQILGKALAAGQPHLVQNQVQHPVISMYTYCTS